MWITPTRFPAVDETQGIWNTSSFPSKQIKNATKLIYDMKHFGMKRKQVKPPKLLRNNKSWKREYQFDGYVIRGYDMLNWSPKYPFHEEYFAAAVKRLAAKCKKKRVLNGGNLWLNKL